MSDENDTKLPSLVKSKDLSAFQKEVREISEKYAVSYVLGAEAISDEDPDLRVWNLSTRGHAPTVLVIATRTYGHLRESFEKDLLADLSDSRKQARKAILDGEW